MLPIREPRSVDFGSIQHIPARIKLRIDEFLRGRFIDGRSEFGGTKAED
jgi:hypothetical protein